MLTLELVNPINIPSLEKLPKSIYKREKMLKQISDEIHKKLDSLAKLPEKEINSLSNLAL
jgi:hypothetical protein